MTRKKTDAKKPADAKPEADQPVEQAGGPAEAAGAVVPGDGANAAEGGSEKPAGAPGTADGADGAPVGEAAAGADGGKADEAREGAEMGEPGEGSAGNDADGNAGDMAGNGSHVDGGAEDKSPEPEAVSVETVSGGTLPGDAPDVAPPGISHLVGDGIDLAGFAWDCANCAAFAMARLAKVYGADVLNGDRHGDAERNIARRLVLQVLVDRIGNRATPDVCWNQLKLSGLAQEAELTVWVRAGLKTFVSVYLELTAYRDAENARIVAENAPAPPKKKIDPEDLTTGTVEGFGATIKTR